MASNFKPGSGFSGFQGSALWDDLAKLATNAAGVAQGAREEAETLVRTRIDRWMAEQDFVSREEFDAVRAMAVAAREENESLKARIEALESKMQG
ncbi:MAG: accessory factor UbiK family protein [Pseudomonadota bacterium]